MKIDMEKFVDAFKDVYHQLYEAEGNGQFIEGYDEAVAKGEAYIASHSELFKEFVRVRGDILSSDRELAAFAMTLDKFGESAKERLYHVTVFKEIQTTISVLAKDEEEAAAIAKEEFYSGSIPFTLEESSDVAYLMVKDDRDELVLEEDIN